MIFKIGKNYMQLGIFLKRFRSETSLSGNGLAKRIGVRRHSLEKWENAGSLPNYCSSIKIQNYFAINSLLEISEETLRNCINQELKEPFKKLILENEMNEKMNIDKNIFEHLRTINARIVHLEKIIKLQEKQIRNLERLIQTGLKLD